MCALIARRQPWWRILVIVGLAAMLAGAVDPLEGSPMVAAAVGLVGLGSWYGHSRQRRSLLWSVGLVAVGVGAMFILSALGGVGGTSGRPLWWALTILPYPVGWILGLVGAIRTLRESSTRSRLAQA